MEFIHNLSFYQH